MSPWDHDSAAFIPRPWAGTPWVRLQDVDTDHCVARAAASPRRLDWHVPRGGVWRNHGAARRRDPAWQVRISSAGGRRASIHIRQLQTYAPCGPSRSQHWQTAMACLLSAPESKGPVMMAQIAVAQAVHVGKPEGAPAPQKKPFNNIGSLDQRRWSIVSRGGKAGEPGTMPTAAQGQRSSL
jgi:hypothetical protein